MTVQLKSGLTTEDPRLDRVPSYDEQSRAFQVRSQLLEAAGVEPRRSSVNYPSYRTLDQGREGACVGFSISHGLNASPIRRRPAMDARFAREQLYWEAQKEDSWPGGSYPGATPAYEGTSTLAGLKVAQRLGLIQSYYWCGAGSQTAADDVVDSLREIGGVLFGIPWYRSMYNTNADGLIEVDPSSGLAGYHAIWSHSFRYDKLPEQRRGKKVEHVIVQNTWGPDWGVKFYGIGGHGAILVEDLEAYLLPREVYGEAAVPVGA